MCVCVLELTELHCRRVLLENKDSQQAQQSGQNSQQTQCTEPNAQNPREQPLDISQKSRGLSNSAEPSSQNRSQGIKPLNTSDKHKPSLSSDQPGRHDPSRIQKPSSTEKHSSIGPKITVTSATGETAERPFQRTAFLAEGESHVPLYWPHLNIALPIRSSRMGLQTPFLYFKTLPPEVDSKDIVQHCR